MGLSGDSTVFLCWFFLFGEFVIFCRGRKERKKEREKRQRFFFFLLLIPFLVGSLGVLLVQRFMSCPDAFAILFSYCLELSYWSACLPFGEFSFCLSF